ncbi:MAG: hypothetical protein HQM14_17725 [SAR324 cluster bacterium]|nr:hypothetical protein [SAR324 cluster bacterium]
MIARLMILLTMLILTACSYTNPYWTKAKGTYFSYTATFHIRELLGDPMIEVLSSPDHVESFQISHLPSKNKTNTLAGYPILSTGNLLEGVPLTQFQSTVFDKDSYVLGITKRCGFFPDSALRFTKKEEIVTILFSFSCNQWIFIQGESEVYEDFDPARAPLLEIIKGLFPENQKIQALK